MSLRLLDQDSIFFDQHKDRQVRIRVPVPGEDNAKFLSLGDHDLSRRRMIVWKVPPGGQMAPGQILRIPFLLFSDESIEDADAVLLPILHDLFMENAKAYGIPVPKKK